jgi:hypothetical protein
LGHNLSGLDHTAKIALALLFVITTMHTQDFQDVQLKVIVLPDISRYTPFETMVPWLFCLSADSLQSQLNTSTSESGGGDQLSFLINNAGRFTLMLGATLTSIPDMAFDPVNTSGLLSIAQRGLMIRDRQIVYTVSASGA